MFNSAVLSSEIKSTGTFIFFRSPSEACENQSVAAEMQFNPMIFIFLYKEN